jgi:serine/threonine protein phosphatase 1
MINLAALPKLVDTTRVYAIADIHGCLDLLLRIEQAINDDLLDRPTEAARVCFLGDYVDRGPDSAGVIEHLTVPSKWPTQRIFLKGNHEDRLLAFLESPESNGPLWIKFGGREALKSYGLSIDELDGCDWFKLGKRFEALLPEKHLTFFKGLELAVRWKDYLFVHAGLDPERTLDAQLDHDLMWIREPFLLSDKNWGLTVVHGHVIRPEPVICAHRIGLDTGAYKSGILTCAAIDDLGIRIIQTTVG